MENKWYSEYISVYGKPYTSDFIGIAEKIKAKINKLQSASPLVSIVIIAHNEGENLLSNLWSVSDMICKYPVEIIGVDNDSTDNTAQIFRDCGIEPFSETEYHTGGASRQKGLDNCKGKYYVCMDGDTMYPPLYVQTMVDVLVGNPEVAAVATFWDFLKPKSVRRFQLWMYELLRDFHLYIQSINRPELAVRAMTLVFVTEYGKKIGFRRDLIRVEDGSLIFKMKKMGKIKFLHSKKTKVLTGWRTMAADGTLSNALWKRVKKQAFHFSEYFTRADKYDDV